MSQSLSPTTKGRFVSNLEQKDFQILDEGKPQNIEFFSRERSQPVVAGFLIDLSNSSRAQWKNFQTAATELILTLLPGKEKFSGYLIGYGNKAEPDGQHHHRSRAFRFQAPRPEARRWRHDCSMPFIWPAPTAALIQGRSLFRTARRVLIVVGDGTRAIPTKEDSLEEALEVAQRNLVTIYGISTVSYGFTNESSDNTT